MTTPEVNKTSDVDIDARSLDSVPSPQTGPADTFGEPSERYPVGIAFRLSRAGSRCHYSALVFSNPDTSQPVYLAEFKAWNASAKRPEIIVHHGSEPGPEENVVGSINFHHWLKDQSRKVEITMNSQESIPSLELDEQDDEAAQAEEVNVPIKLSRSHVWAKHNFALNGQQYSWRETRDRGGDTPKRFYQRHLECRDSSGQRVAMFYLESYRGAGEDRVVGRFQVVKEDGLSATELQCLLVTFLAVYVKLRKRAMQGIQAGNLGGLVTTALYAVQG